MFRQVILAAVAVLLACVGSAAHLETVFSVSLPCSETLASDAFLFGDAIYVICGTYGGVLSAVNLTTRTNMWNSPNFAASYGGIATFTVMDPVVLVDLGGAIVALSSQTGQQLWIQANYQLANPATAFTFGGTIYAQVITMDGSFALQAFDLATGAAGYFQYINGLLVDGSTAFVFQVTGGLVDLRAIDITTNISLWEVPISATTAILGLNSEYVVASNSSGADEIALVLHRKNGTVAHALQAFTGLEPGVVLHGNVMFAAIGLDYPRYVLVDLRTGYITWTRSLREVGDSAVFTGAALVSISQELVLTVTPIGSDAPSISIPQVPSLPSPTLVDYGSGLLQVANLQGYTMWDINTGSFVGSNEQEPNAALLTPPTWNGMSIVVSGNVVSALKVVPKS